MFRFWVSCSAESTERSRLRNLHSAVWKEVIVIGAEII